VPSGMTCSPIGGQCTGNTDCCTGNCISGTCQGG
jgi:hypothetical protein